MKTCVIFCAGEFAALAEPIAPDSLVIAADGGLQHLQKLGIRPDVILGDFDSLGYVPQGALVYPVEKDDTDCMLAIKKGLALDFHRFVIYGGMDGKRTDHTVANFQALHYLAERGAQGFLVGCRENATVIRNDRITFSSEQTGYLSVFCLGGDATGVQIRGLQYPLENGTLSAGFPLGVSNHFVGQEAMVSVENGALLLIWKQGDRLQ